LKVSVDCGILDHGAGGSVVASRATRTTLVMGRYPGTPGCGMGLTLMFSRQMNATLSTPPATAKTWPKKGPNAIEKEEEEEEEEEEDGKSPQIN